MTNREKINWLKRYIWLDREITAKLTECEQLRAKLGKITPTLSFQPPGGGSIHKSTDHDLINRITDLESSMNKNIDTLIIIRAEIEQVIMLQENDQERLLLHHRYIDGKTWIQVCVLMNYKWAQTHRIHSNALKNLNMIQNDTSIRDII